MPGTHTVVSDKICHLDTGGFYVVLPSFLNTFIVGLVGF